MAKREHVVELFSNDYERRLCYDEALDRRKMQMISYIAEHRVEWVLIVHDDITHQVVVGNDTLSG